MKMLENTKIAVLLAKMHDEREFWYPVIRLKEAGAKVVVVAGEAGKKYKGKEGMAAVSDKAFGEVKAADFDGVVIPGGYGPDHLRRDKDCLKLVRDLNDQGKMVAYICHAGWVPISAGIVKGKKATSVKAIRDDMVNAGVKWEDSALVVDGNMITSRDPDDLPEFMKGVITFLQGGKKK